MRTLSRAEISQTLGIDVETRVPWFFRSALARSPSQKAGSLGFVDIRALVHRSPMVPFAPGSGLPWNDPDFSRRMLKEHLSQDHDRASRRFEVIDQQVAWIHHAVLGGRSGRVLDLACGPGLHTQRLAGRGHACTGLDFSPASIRYAQDQVSLAGGDCQYRLVDICEADLGSGFDAVLMLFGEFNTLPPADARSLLERVALALEPSGRLVLELHFDDYVRALGEEEPRWSAQAEGLFSDQPHLVLHESRWHPDDMVTTERYWVLEEGRDAVSYSFDTRAYSDEELAEMLASAGLSITGRYESLTGDLGSPEELFGLVAEPSALASSAPR